MNSTIFDDLSRETIALETANNLKRLLQNTQNINVLHKELLELNLTITAYIEESRRRLQEVRLDLANNAKTAETTMSSFISSPCKRNPNPKRNMAINNLKFDEANNNSNISKCSERTVARNFISWYKSLVDKDRPNLGLYLADNVTLEWFGRTIRTQKKVAAFLKYDMQCTRHDFRSVESIDGVQTRQERISRQSVSTDDGVLAANLVSPHSPEVIRRNRKRPGLRSSSPDWESPEAKRKKDDDSKYGELHDDISNKGDGVMTRSGRRKCDLVTPPNREVGQGDCIPSTSQEKLPTPRSPKAKKAVECTGFIEFTRTKNNRGVDNMKWERKCKVQISYSEDPYNPGEYILWAIHYTDESKCRRNLLSAFEEC